MAIKSVRFHSADDIMRKGFLHVMNGLLHSVKAGKRPGDSIEVTMDDGSVEHYTLGDHAMGGADLSVNVHPGKEA